MAQFVACGCSCNLGPNHTPCHTLFSFFTSLVESGIEIKKPANMSETYFTDSIRMPFLTRLADNINGRFEDKSLLESFDVFNPSKLPTLSSIPSKTELDNFMTYGNTQIQTIVKQYYREDGTTTSIASLQECFEGWSG